jgi:hypothetical protein
MTPFRVESDSRGNKQHSKEEPKNPVGNAVALARKRSSEYTTCYTSDLHSYRISFLPAPTIKIELFIGPEAHPYGDWI